jgi:hypothetical protein
VKKFIKISTVAVLLFILAFVGCIYFPAPRPPKEAKIIQQFNEHRAAFEQLRNMLQTDANLRRIAYWGVETEKPFFLGYPTGTNFSIDRFNKYISLFEDVGALAAWRDEGMHADVGIGIWAWGLGR